MSLSSQPVETRNHGLYELAPLTDENIVLLHEIVTAAQQLPAAQEHPFRSLFTAYDAVMDQRGLDKDHDQIYFRFLLRLATFKDRGTLYDKFEALLAKVKVYIASGQNDDSAELQDIPYIPRGRRRRVSFDSIYDAGDESARKGDGRTRSHSWMSHQRGDNPVVRLGRPSTRASTRTTERTQSHDEVSSLHSRGPARNLFQHHGPGVRAGSDQVSLKIRQRSISRASFASQDRQDGMDSKRISRTSEWALEQSSGQSGLEDKETVNDDSSEHMLCLSDTQMCFDAEQFYDNHMRRLGRSIFRRWHASTVEIRFLRDNLATLALNHDRLTLLRQALDTWRVAFHEKRQILETEHFFEHIERRATKARDLYLVTKAFTHWAQSASDQAQRTSVARRHILRTKCFNAWRDVTVINELKVRRQTLKKFFVKWRQRHVVTASAELKAVIAYEENLTSRCYWTWFWCSREREALGVWSIRTKQNYFTKLLKATRERRQTATWVEEGSKMKLLRRLYTTWSEKTHTIENLEHQAANYHARSLALRVLSIWKEAARLAPIERHISFNLEWRISREVFLIWLRRARVSKQAAAVNKLRLLRNSWTTWNDRLRWQAVSSRVNERIVLQTLYKWVLVERSLLLKRLFEKRLMQTSLRKLIEFWSNRRAQLSQCERIFKESRENKAKGTILRRLCVQMIVQRQRERLAFEFNAPRVARETLQIWNSQLQRVHILDDWAQDAAFYFVTKKALKGWQVALKELKRQRRKTAYTRTRRMVKVNLATRILERLQQRSLEIAQMKEEAERAERSRLFQVAREQIVKWRNYLRSITEMRRQSDILYEHSVMKKHLYLWTDVFEQRRKSVEQAEYHAQVRTLDVAATLLRRWRMLVLAHRGREMNAALFKERNERTQFRNILRHWQSRAARRRSHKPTRSFGRSMITRQDIADGHTGNGTARAEDWSAFDDGFDLGDWIPGPEAIHSTPMPGYLSTPSKRAARAKALVRLSATPATSHKTPLERRIFPVEHDLRTTEFGKSILGKRRGVG